MTEATNGINDATEIIKSIPDFMDAATELLKTPYGWVVLAGMVAWFILNKNISGILSGLSQAENKKIERLESYVSNPESANEETLKVLKDLRDTHYFKFGTGIYAERRLREALIKLHTDNSHTINWTHIRRALPYLTSNQSLEINVREMTKQEKLGYYYNIFTSCLFFILSAAILIVFITSRKYEITQIFTGLGASLACLVFALFVLTQNFPESSAKTIKESLKKAKRAAR